MSKDAVELSCKEAARLMSQRLDRPLTEAEDTALREHLLICGNCRRFEGQLSFLGRAAKRYAKGTS